MGGSDHLPGGCPRISCVISTERSEERNLQESSDHEDRDFSLSLEGTVLGHHPRDHFHPALQVAKALSRERIRHSTQLERSRRKLELIQILPR
jgi:hypothetical protein